RQGAGAAHGRRAARRSRRPAGRCRRRAGGGDHPCAHAREHAAYRDSRTGVEEAAMIGRLHGTLVAKRPPWIVLDVHGVGYELEVPMSTLYDLPDAGREVTLLTHYAIREDTAALYGFLRDEERALFR